MTISAAKQYSMYLTVLEYTQCPVAGRYFCQHIWEWYNIHNNTPCDFAICNYLDKVGDLSSDYLDRLISKLVLDPNFQKCVQDFKQPEPDV
jgi:hypothetical protein